MTRDHSRRHAFSCFKCEGGLGEERGQEGRKTAALFDPLLPWTDGPLASIAASPLLGRLGQWSFGKELQSAYRAIDYRNAALILRRAGHDVWKKTFKGTPSVPWPRSQVSRRGLQNKSLDPEADRPYQANQGGETTGKVHASRDCRKNEKAAGFGLMSEKRDEQTAL